MAVRQRCPAPSNAVQVPSLGDLMFNYHNRNFTAMGGSCHQRVEFVPVTGWCLVSLVYEAPANQASWQVNSWAVAGGRSYSEVEPKNPDGTPVAWASGGPLTVTAGSATANTIVETATPQMLVYIPPDATYPGWGALYCRSKNTTALAGSGRGVTGSIAHTALIPSVAKRYKTRYEYAAAATAVTSNTFTLTSSADINDDNRSIGAFQIRITPLGRSYQVASAGDSRDQGDRTTGDIWGWAGASCEAVTLATGIPIGYERYSLSGSNHATFHAFMMDRLAKSGRRLPDLAILQGSSSNGSTWTADDVAQAMNRNLAFVAECKRLGIRGALTTPYPSVSASNSTSVANWAALGAAIRSSKCPIFDFQLRPEFTNGAAIPILPQNTGIAGDNAHLNNAGVAIAVSTVGAPGIRRILCI
jgi:hypothetical protein